MMYSKDDSLKILVREAMTVAWIQHNKAASPLSSLKEFRDYAQAVKELKKTFAGGNKLQVQKKLNLVAAVSGRFWNIIKYPASKNSMLAQYLLTVAAPLRGISLFMENLPEMEWKSLKAKVMDGRKVKDALLLEVANEIAKENMGHAIQDSLRDHSTSPFSEPQITEDKEEYWELIPFNEKWIGKEIRTQVKIPRTNFVSKNPYKYYPQKFKELFELRHFADDTDFIGFMFAFHLWIVRVWELVETGKREDYVLAINIFGPLYSAAMISMESGILEICYHQNDLRKQEIKNQITNLQTLMEVMIDKCPENSTEQRLRELKQFFADVALSVTNN